MVVSIFVCTNLILENVFYISFYEKCCVYLFEYEKCVYTWVKTKNRKGEEWNLYIMNVFIKNVVWG